MMGSFKQWIAEARGGKIDWDELEASLIQSDLGMELSERILEQLKSRPLSAETIQEAVMDEIRRTWTEPPRKLDDSLADATAEHPQVVLIVGVNGSGKTTTCAKLAHRYQEKGQKVFMVGADTFRAAAIEQLERWSQTIGCGFFPGKAGGDPAAAAYQGTEAGIEYRAGLILIDTAGRLHNKNNLLRELEKVKRVVGKVLPDTPQETLLVVDGTSGANSLRQVEEFHNTLGLTGLIVTKLDSSSKGGIIAAVKAEHDVDTLMTGTGESPDDLHPFELKNYLQEFR